jgi:hypothetical protein
MFTSVPAAMMYPLIEHGTSGRVYKGSWNKTNVALKVLMVEEGVAPSSPVRQE